MTLRIRLVPLAVAAFVAAFPSQRLTAQQAVGISLGVGATLPRGGSAGSLEPGVHGLASAWLSPDGWPIALRADAMFHAVGRSPRAFTQDRFEVPSLTAGVVFPVGNPARSVRPYVTAGLGSYNTDLGSGKEWHFGWNWGAGVQLRLSNVRLFGEARVHHIADGSPTRLIPLTFGVTF